MLALHKLLSQLLKPVLEVAQESPAVKETQAAEVEEALPKYTLYFTENTSELDSGQLDCFINFLLVY